VNLDLKRYGKAKGYYLRSNKLCSDEKFSYSHDLALEGVALSEEKLGDFDSAIEIYNRLHADKTRAFPLPVGIVVHAAVLADVCTAVPRSKYEFINEVIFTGVIIVGGTFAPHTLSFIAGLLK
jgi:hypothetical protein